MSIIPAFHGTNQQFEQFSQDKARLLNDFYGGGVAYFTENFQVAKQYAAAAVKRTGGDPVIYRSQLHIKKLFDVDGNYTGKDIKPLIGSNYELFARAAGLLNLGADKYRVLSDLKSCDIVLTGEQLYKGMSGGMRKTAVARDKLKKNGYDALRYNGGVNMAAVRHNVYIMYYARDIRITGTIK